MRTFILLVSFVTCFSLSKAANITWTNGNGTGIWNDAANWSAGIPGSGDVAVFNAISTADCLIDISINVSGISIEAAYAGTVTQGAGNSITIGNGDFSQAAGRFEGGDSDIDFNNGTFTLSGGTFVSTSASMFWDQSVTISGGNFHHNNGTVVYDDAGNRSLDLPTIDTLYHFIMEAGLNNRRFTLSSDDTLYVESKLELNQGRLQNGYTFVADTLEINTSYDNGTTTIYAVGNQNGHFIVDGDLGTHDYFIRKDDNQDTVFVFDQDDDQLSWGNNQDLTLLSGSISFLDGLVDLNFSDMTFDGGVFTASSGSTNYYGNWNNTAGKFEANGGSWEYDHDNNRSYSTYTVDTFNILTCSATNNNRRINMTAGDTIEVLQRLTLSNGMIKTGIVKVNDTLEFESNYDGENGAADIYFVGANNSHVLVPTFLGEHNYFIRKSAANDTVKIINPNSTSVTFGDTQRDLNIIEGVLDLSEEVSVDLNFAAINIETGGTLLATDGTTNYQGEWNNIGGSFKANGGTWIWDHDNNRAYVSHQNDTFNILICEATNNNRRINLGATDTIEVLQRLNLVNGQFKNGVIKVYDTLTVQAGYDNEAGQSDIYFVGNTTSHYLVSSNQGEFDVFVRKDNPTDTVYFDQDGSSDLVIGDTDRDLDVIEGVAAFNRDNTADINYQSILIRDGGEVLATSGTTNYQGAWNNIGGSFKANGGTWIWDHNNDRDYDSHQVDTFNILSCDASSNNKRINLDATDTIYVAQRLDLVDGQFLGGTIKVADTLDMSSTAYDNSSGQSDILLVGSVNGEIIIDNNDFNHDIYLQKDDPTTNVNVYDSDAGDLTFGNDDASLFIQEGRLEFRDNANVDFEFIDLNLEAGGTLQATSNTLTFIGNWYNQGGKFEHNNGDFLYAASNHRDYETTVVDTFFNFEFSATGGNRFLTMAADDTIRVLNDLTLTNGRIRNGVLSVAGDVNVESAYDPEAQSASLQFIGSNTQNFDLSGASSNFDGDIILDKSVAEEVTLLSLFDLDGSNQDVTFNKGYLVTTNSNVLFVDGNDHDMLNMNDSSFVRGPVEKRNNGDFTFPVGDSTIYAPLSIINVNGTATQFRAQYFRTNPDDDGYSTDNTEASVENVSTIEYWNLDRTNTTNNCQVSLSWRPTSAVATPAELVVSRWNGLAMQWEDQGNSATSGDANNGTVSSNFVTDFSPFTLGSSNELNNPLPVEYLFFEVAKLPSSNHISWATASEQNADYFLVQKSLNGISWNDIGKRTAHGNSQTDKYYSFDDFNIQEGTVYYRLKQVDFDGQFEFSEVISIKRISSISDRNNSLIIFPNPYQEGKLSIVLPTSNIQNAVVNLYSLTGKLLLEVELDSANQEVDEFSFQLPKLSPGAYLIRFQNAEKSYSRKLIVR